MYLKMSELFVKQNGNNILSYQNIISCSHTNIEWNFKNNIAIYIGTFDPPHIGHKMVVDSLLMSGFIDAVIIVPTYKHCFKENISKFNDRMKMLLDTFDNTINVAISNIERELCEIYNIEINYTYDTLNRLQEQLPKSKLYLTVGSDLLQKIDIWHNREIYLNYNIIVICRDTYPISISNDFIQQLLINDKLIIIGQDLPFSNINSTLIRKNIANSIFNTLIGIIHSKVLEYIYNNTELLEHYKKKCIN